MTPKELYDDPGRWLVQVEQVFRDQGVQWALMGGLAAMQYRARPRHTSDLDFVVDRQQEIAKALTELGFTVRTLTNPGEDHPYLIQAYGPDGIQVDIFVAETDFEVSVLARREKAVVSCEDLIVYKLMAWRPQDRDDIDEIIATGRELDVEYIERWAERWDVLPNWKAALDSCRDSRGNDS